MTRYDGILLCDKPAGITSHDVIDRLRQAIGQKKIGHTGTLDPRATGLMVICLGRATKITQFMAEVDKTYEAEVYLGRRSTTFDAEGVIGDEPPAHVPNLTTEDLEKILNAFRGVIRQKVPAFSAVKIDGQPLYKRARRGEIPDTPERQVEIKAIDLIAFEPPLLTIAVTCSKGTYIRSLANDIGDKVGCGAYLAGLRRTRVGHYRLSEALSIDQVRQYREAGRLNNYLKSIEAVLPFPSITVNRDFSSAVLTGKPLRKKDITAIDEEFSTDQLISLKNGDGRILAIGKAGMDSADLGKNDNGGFFTYVRVLN